MGRISPLKQLLDKGAISTRSEILVFENICIVFD